jgi:TPR repeat protein
MKADRLIWMVLLLCMGTALQLSAQESTADRKRLDQIKAKADKGDAEAQIELAGLYVAGDGVTRDPAKAAKWRRKAAEQGNARAQCLLGLQYADGDGVKKNMGEAVYWLGKAADQDLAEAQLDLGLCFANGQVPGKSVVDAVELYRKAANQGLPEAESALGNCYFEGVGVPKNIPEGVKWTQKAAEHGQPGAQHALGLCYAKGKGVTTNYVQAYKWLALAAAKDNQNSDDIKVNLSMVERFMTPEQIAEGQKLAHEFVSGGASTPGESSPQTDSAKSHPPGVASTPASLPKTGSVLVKADDDTHEIFADGAFVGNTPAKLKLTPGPHLIEVKKAGFNDYRKEIQVGEGSELTLRATLQKR